MVLDNVAIGKWRRIRGAPYLFSHSGGMVIAVSVDCDRSTVLLANKICETDRDGDNNRAGSFQKVGFGRYSGSESPWDNI